MQTPSWFLRQWAFPLLALMAVSPAVAAPPKDNAGKPPLPDFAHGPALRPRLPVRGAERLSLELRALVQQYAAPATRGGGARFSKEQLKSLFGIEGSERDPLVLVAIAVTDKPDTDQLRSLGVRIWSASAGQVFASVPVSQLLKVADLRFVRSVSPLSEMRVPPRPSARAGAGERKPCRMACPDSTLPLPVPC
jgi:hypothetical protein